MDITPTSILPPKSPDPEPETPTRIHHQPPKSIPFSNGFLKRHPHNIPIVITYKECLKNHAATIGGHALDGCGEFMPSPTATHTDPTSLKCAACGCHRNFHRREPDDYPPNSPPAIEFQPHHRHHPPPPVGIRSPSSSSPPPISSAFIPSAPHMLLALSTGGDVGNTPGTSLSSPRKRFRTKFSQTQKEKMFRFAEKLGWKMQKRDEELIQEFCNEIKVEKTVFKVWMHNNKNSFGKRALLDSVINGIGIVNPTTTTTTTPPPVTNNVVISNLRSDDDHDDVNNSNDEQKQFVVAANAGSSSSS